MARKRKKSAPLLSIKNILALIGCLLIYKQVVDLYRGDPVEDKQQARSLAPVLSEEEQAKQDFMLWNRSDYAKDQAIDKCYELVRDEIGSYFGNTVVLPGLLSRPGMGQLQVDGSWRIRFVFSATSRDDGERKRYSFDKTIKFDQGGGYSWQ